MCMRVFECNAKGAFEIAVVISMHVILIRIKLYLLAFMRPSIRVDQITIYLISHAFTAITYIFVFLNGTLLLFMVLLNKYLRV